MNALSCCKIRHIMLLFGLNKLFLAVFVHYKCKTGIYPYV